MREFEDREEDQVPDEACDDDEISFQHETLAEAFQHLYDELVRMGRKDVFRTETNKKLSDLEEKIYQGKNQLDDNMLSVIYRASGENKI